MSNLTRFRCACTGNIDAVCGHGVEVKLDRLTGADHWRKKPSVEASFVDLRCWKFLFDKLCSSMLFFEAAVLSGAQRELAQRRPIKPFGLHPRIY